MANTYTWSIDRLLVAQTPNPDSVVTAYYSIVATDGVTTVSESGLVDITEQGAAANVPYANLQEANIFGFITAAKGPEFTTQIEVQLAARLVTLGNLPPAPMAKDLPWVTE